MTDRNLIQNIQLLKQIKPSQNWVVSVKKEILGRELGGDLVSPNWIEVFGRLLTGSAFAKPAFVTITSIFVIIGIFGLSQNSLPGDLFYPIKQLSEKGQTVFTPENEKSALRLEFADRKVEELAKIAAKPGPKDNNLIVALQALSNEISAASKQIKNVTPEKKEILAAQTDEIIKNTQKILANMGGSEDEGINTALSNIVSREIQDLETRTLTEVQKELLTAAKQDFEAGNFGQALEKIWQIANE